MAQQLLHDSEADANLRRRQKYDAYVTGGSDKPTSAEAAKTDTAAKTAADKAKPGALSRAASAAGSGLDAATKGGMEALASIPHGVASGLEGLWNAKTVDEGVQSLKTTVMSGLMAGIWPAVAVGGGVAGVVSKLKEKLPANLREQVKLQDGSVVRAMMGGHPGKVSDKRFAEMTEEERKAYQAKQDAFHAPMDIDEFLGNVTTLGTAAGAHGLGAKRAGQTFENPAAKPAPPAPQAPNEARFAAAAPPAEPPLPGKFEATPEWAAKNNARVAWEKDQVAAVKAKTAEIDAKTAAVRDEVARLRTEPPAPAPPAEVPVTEALPLKTPPLEVVKNTEGMQGDAAEAQINGEMGIGKDVAGDQAPAPEQPTSPLQASQDAPGSTIPEPAAAGTPPAEAPTAGMEDPMAGTEGFTPPSAEGAAAVGRVPDPAFEGTEMAGAPMAAPPRTVNGVHELVSSVAQPAADAAAAPLLDAVAREKQVRSEATANAQAMRAAGASRDEVNAVYRARLNEAGIRSKNQTQADKWVEAHLADPTAVARTVTSEILKNPADPEPGITAAMKKLGMPDDQAGQMATDVIDHLKQNGMDDGAGGVDLTAKLEASVAGVTEGKFDRVAANRALAEKVRKLCP